jgi:hypothetical protein
MPVKRAGEIDFTWTVRYNLIILVKEIGLLFISGNKDHYYHSNTGTTTPGRAAGVSGRDLTAV